jgi:hypothetical protein
MQGGQRRDFVVLRMVLGIACVAVVGLMAAPVALAGSPAGDQYGSALPGGGSGGNTSGSDPSGGSTTIPVAPNSSSSSQTAAGGSSDSSATNAKGNDTGSKGGSSHKGHKADTQKASGNGSGGPGTVNLDNSGNSVPQVAADSAGDSWLPFFIGGMVLLACAAAALVIFRNRRRTAQG